MNLQQLEYIVALDKQKSFSKAAESCFITQATLSTMVKKLENELDVILFDRKSSPIITTEVGRLIINEAQKVLFHSYQLKQLSSETKGTIQGELKIGIIPTIASNLLHRILPSMLEKYPDLTLSIQEFTTHTIINKLKANELDVGIISTPLNIEGINKILMYYEKLLVYGNIKNDTVKFISTKDLAKEKIWLLEKGNCLTDQIINLCSLRPKKMNSNLNFFPNSFDSLLNIVDKMKGLTLIPELYYADLPKPRKNKVIDFYAPFPVREVSAVFLRPYAKLRIIETLAEEIKQIIAPILQTSALKNSQMKIAKI